MIQAAPPDSAGAAPEYREGGAVTFPSERERVGGILLFHYSPRFLGYGSAANLREHVDSFERYSRFPVWAVNTATTLPPALARFDFAAIVFHHSLFGAKAGSAGPHSGTPYYLLDEGHLELASRSRAYKVAFFQDEFTYCQARFEFCRTLEIDCVYTCFEPSEHERVWGAYTDVPEVRSVLPGYVDERLVDAAGRFALPDRDRDIDIGYRGRPTPVLFDTTQEKSEIGRRFAELAGGSGLRLDIALGMEDRLYGDDWYRFLGRCKGALGVESGVTVVDLDDRVRGDYERIFRAKGEVTLEDLRRGALPEYEGQVIYRTIAPRHFEAAAFETCQVLFEGRYSGLIEPDVHYLALKKDFSNFSEVVERFKDPALRRRITARAKADLIDSGAYGYDSFIAGFDRDLERAGLDLGVGPDLKRRVDRAVRRGRVARAVRARGRRDTVYVRNRALGLLGRAIAPLRRRESSDQA